MIALLVAAALAAKPVILEAPKAPGDPGQVIETCVRPAAATLPPAPWSPPAQFTCVGGRLVPARPSREVEVVPDLGRMPVFGQTPRREDAPPNRR